MSSAPPPLNASPSAREEFRTAMGAWFHAAGRDLPWRRTADPYAILVSEVMLQQTQVATVIPYFTRWLQRFPDVRALAAASEAEVLSAWQGLGYYARARNLQKAARFVVEHLDGEMPRTLPGLLALPGAGRYTAGAIASFAYDLPTPAVDANIGRVLARLFDLRAPIDTTAGREALWSAAEILLPLAGGRLHTSALMELGALICIPRRPRCLECPVRRWCAACVAGDPESLPRKSPRRATVALEEHCAWISENGRLLLAQQAGTRWAGLWKLPLLREPPLPAEPPLWQAVYPFTHHRVTLRVFPRPSRPPQKAEAWFTVRELETLALPSPHRRAVVGLLPRGL